jgi:hypothetical protein
MKCRQAASLAAGLGFTAAGALGSKDAEEPVTCNKVGSDLRLNRRRGLRQFFANRRPRHLVYPSQCHLRKPGLLHRDLQDDHAGGSENEPKIPGCSRSPRGRQIDGPPYCVVLCPCATPAMQVSMTLSTYPAAHYSGLNSSASRSLVRPAIKPSPTGHRCLAIELPGLVAARFGQDRIRRCYTPSLRLTSFIAFQKRRPR